jgi:hypothetical protein
MKRAFRLIAPLVAIFPATAPFSLAKVDIQDSPASQSAGASQATDASATSNDANTPAEPKKAKKVWTNENLTEVSGSAISQIGGVKNGQTRKSEAAKAASPQVVATLRKQLAAFQAQLADIDKQIADLKSFSKGKSSPANGLQMHKSYTMEPIQDQVLKLEKKRKILAAQMDTVFDAARKRGVEPGQLR